MLQTRNCTHILFVEVDHALLKRDIFGLVGFAELLKNLSGMHDDT